MLSAARLRSFPGIAAVALAVTAAPSLAQADSVVVFAAASLTTAM